MSTIPYVIEQTNRGERSYAGFAIYDTMQYVKCDML